MNVWEWFTESNWESFAPDLLVGLATGLVVGLVLWFFQLRNEAAADKRELQRSWNALQPRLAPRLARVVAPSTPSLSFLEPVQQISEILELIEDKPTGLWHKSLGGSRLRDLHRLDLAANEVIDLGNRLDVFLKRESEKRFALMTPPPHEMEYGFYRAHILARAYGVTNHRFSGYAEQVWISEEIINAPTWQLLFPAYKAAWTAMNHALSQLSRAFADDSIRKASMHLYLQRVNGD